MRFIFCRTMKESQRVLRDEIHIVYDGILFFWDELKKTLKSPGYDLMGLLSEQKTIRSNGGLYEEAFRAEEVSFQKEPVSQ